MRTSLNITNKLNLISQMQGDSAFQILEYDQLNGSKNVDLAVQLNFMRESGVKLKQVRIILDDSSVRLESGALSYLKGDIEIHNKIGGPLGLGKKFLTSKVTGETMFKPTYSGTGEIFLEPSFGHYALIELEDDEIVVDDGLFYACEESVEVGAAMQKSISSMLLGNEGVFQTRLTGSGIVVLELPVPETEIFKCKLNKDVLKVDGNFAILRTGDIEFTVEKASKSIVGTATSGEGFLNVYRGTGEVWLVPTVSVYNELLRKGLSEISNPSGSYGKDEE
ncbi:AIM24 family protein [Inconstantimicrobium mannanitabidum]|uniref:Transcriptional regulator n=1 Tax=Inconstantimicrobium mannanitabidum TaxID=1604901 RepID=A0ACB5RIH6_9CLOT|nr:AIM24 family protein [Clostridium sp. TW13]GKX68897.1 transcriptional regulator [Clostridium sp. TW13]